MQILLECIMASVAQVYSSYFDLCNFILQLSRAYCVVPDKQPCKYSSYVYRRSHHHLTWAIVSHAQMMDVVKDFKESYVSQNKCKKFCHTQRSGGAKWSERAVLNCAGGEKCASVKPLVFSNLILMGVGNMALGSTALFRLSSRALFLAVSSRPQKVQMHLGASALSRLSLTAHRAMNAICV